MKQPYQSGGDTGDTVAQKASGMAIGTTRKGESMQGSMVYMRGGRQSMCSLSAGTRVTRPRLGGVPAGTGLAATNRPHCATLYLTSPPSDHQLLRDMLSTS